MKANKIPGYIAILTKGLVGREDCQPNQLHSFPNKTTDTITSPEHITTNLNT
jgi:hypothetical protein